MCCRCGEAAAKQPYVDILHFLRQKRCKRTPTTLARICEVGDKQQVNQVMRTGIKGDASACAHAAKRQVTIFKEFSVAISLERSAQVPRMHTIPCLDCAVL
jgi:hypothetical protein